MNDQSCHCPFLNRCDSRCARFLSLERLNYAFEHCMGEYPACVVYDQLLTERRHRRAMVVGRQSPFVQLTVNRQLAASA